MSIKVENITIVHRVVGKKHVVTSPDVPELHVSHFDEVTARETVQPALDALARVQDRIAARAEQARILKVA